MAKKQSTAAPPTPSAPGSVPPVPSAPGSVPPVPSAPGSTLPVQSAPGSAHPTLSAPETTAKKAIAAGGAPPPPPPPPNARYKMHSEASHFDFVAVRNVERPTNVFESAVHLIKGCLGGGIMGVHEAYDKAGVWIALIFTVIFGLYISYCVWIIVQSAQVLYRRLHVTGMSYPDVAEACLLVGPFPKLRKFAKCFRYAVDVIICVDLFGSCCVYQLMIAKTIMQLQYTIRGFEGNIVAYDTNSVRLYVVFILVPIILICMITTLKYLAPFSAVANCFIVLVVFATVGYAANLKPNPADITFFNTIGGFCEFCGVIVFSMEGIGVALPIENNMKKPNHFHWALIIGMTTVVTFVCLVGFFGAWGFKEHLQSPVTLNFPPSWFPTVLKGSMGVMIYVTFALNFWAPFNLVWFYLQKLHNPRRYWLWERVWRAIIIVLITLVTIAFPNIGNLMGMLGALCLSNMGFIFPAFIELMVVWQTPGLGRGKWILWKNIFIMILGATLGVSSAYYNGKGLIVAQKTT